MAAIRQNGRSLQYTSDELKNNHEIVLAAVNQSGHVLKSVSESMKNDRDVVLTAVNQNGYALQYASDELKNDLVLLKLLQQYHTDIDRNINNYTKRYQQWYRECMSILDILTQQELLEKFIPNKTGKAKTRKF